MAASASKKHTFDPAAHAKGAGHARFTFQVRDNGGTASGGQDTDQLANTITINVNAVNFFFFNDTATTEIYTLSLHDALPIYFGFSDPVEGNALAAVKISTLPVSGLLKYN